LNAFIYGSHMYAKVVVVSKVPLPNYRYDLDDKRPLREVCWLVTYVMLTFLNHLRRISINEFR